MEMQEQMRVVAGKVVNKKLYFSEKRFNGLFCLDLSTDECSFVAPFLNVSFDSRVLHRKCVQFGDWLYFLPERISYIHAYNVVTGKQECFNLQEIGIEGPYIYEPVIWKNKLFYFSVKSGSAVYVLDLVRHVLQKDDRFKRWTRSAGVDADFGYRLGWIEEKVYLVEREGNRIVCWNLETGEGEIIESRAKRLFGVTCVQKGIWVYTQDGPNLYYRDLGGNEYMYEGRHVYRNEIVFNHVINVNENIICVPKQGSELEVFNQEEKHFQTIDVLQDVQIDFEEDMRFFGYDVEETVLYLFFAEGHGFIKFDTSTKEVKWISTTFTKVKDFRCLEALRMKKIWKRDGIVYEGGGWSLDGFFALDGDRQEQQAIKLIGEKIYKSVESY